VPPGSTDDAPGPWAVDAGELTERFEVDPSRGLSGAEVEERRLLYGPNSLEFRAERAWTSILLDQFKGVLVLLLAGAAVLSAAFGQWAEAAAVMVVLLLNALIGFVTELRAVRSVEALRRLGVSHVRVRREGHLETVPADELVPGDVLLVEGGDLVGADARVLSASRLEADESSLTGESVPVFKEPASVPAAAPLPERRSMLYKGTPVTRGAGEALVVATGMDTELGRISHLVDQAATAESTPLEARLSGLAQRLVWLTLAVATLITLTGLGSGKSWLVLLQTAVALAVAAVPEGLPIIATLTLAQGVRRMARRNALVNRLSAVETLGATSVIITDKTGTLTENRMRVAALWLPGGEVAMAGDPPGVGQPAPAAFRGTGQAPELAEQLRRALTAAALCASAELPEPGGVGGEGVEGGSADGEGVEGEGVEGEGVGDPLELALLRAARSMGIERADLLASHPELRQEAFDSETRLMATTHRRHDAEGNARAWVLVKGAPGEVIAKSTSVSAGAADGARNAIGDAERRTWLARNRELAARGLRVLALAERVTDAPPDGPYEDLSLLGLVALADPPREDAAAAIAGCHSAGIRVIMATGDQVTTARSVAESVGLNVAGGVLDGNDVARLLAAGEEGSTELLATNVLARLAPEQKLELIELHQQAGNVVAMTGDGVNDAPALRRADIGVAMGLHGTEVAREAADMVLLDDAFGTIVAAVKEGRVIFDNIRAFVVFLLSCNLSEILVIGLAGVAGRPLPLLPLQILYLNLITDVFPALALGAGRGDKRILERPPRPAAEPLIAGRHWRTVFGYGGLLTLSTLGAFLVALELLGASEGEAVTVAFLTLALGQLWHVFNMRDPGSSLLNNQVTRNRWVWAATLLCTLLIAVTVAFPPLRQLLGIELLDSRGWWLVIGAGLTPMIVGQVGKALGLGKVS
jgi:Ca2+-transporting ATPase